MKPELSYKIMLLPEERWQEFKEIRMEALRLEPVAFAEQFIVQADKPDSDWKRRLVREYPARLKLFMEIDGKLVGTIGSFCEKEDPHTATIIMVYVRPEFRGRGYGKLMFLDILERLSKLPEINKLKLSVAASQIPAYEMYKSLGFKEVGRQKDEITVDGIKYDNISMAKPNAK
jgi:ribosomal protein S18 acetylase RimI-like enzyme